jgi:hypothetical protein
MGGTTYWVAIPAWSVPGGVSENTPSSRLPVDHPGLDVPVCDRGGDVAGEAHNQRMFMAPTEPMQVRMAPGQDLLERPTRYDVDPPPVLEARVGCGSRPSRPIRPASWPSLGRVTTFTSPSISRRIRSMKVRD